MGVEVAGFRSRIDHSHSDSGFDVVSNRRGNYHCGDHDHDLEVQSSRRSPNYGPEGVFGQVFGVDVA